MGEVEYRRSKAEATPVMPSSPGAVHETVTLFQLSARAPVASATRPVRASETTGCSLIDPPFVPGRPGGLGSRARAARSVPPGNPVVSRGGRGSAAAEGDGFDHVPPERRQGRRQSHGRLGIGNCTGATDVCNA